MSTVRVGLSIAAATLFTLLPQRDVAAQVRFERTGYRLTSLGERMAVSARIVDGQRRPVASARIRWRIADSSIATVSPAGIVISRRPGYTKLWAVAGSDSASALILVDQWASKFEFAPAAVRFDAVGSRQPLRVIVRDAAGHPIGDGNRRTATCRSVNEGVVALAANGELNARGNGITYVRCSDRGIADSVRVEVRQRAASAQIIDKLLLANKTVGDTFRIRLTARDRVGDEIRDVQATWASSNSSVVRVDPLLGNARSVGSGIVKVVAQVGDVTDTVSITVQPGSGLPLTVAVDTAGSADFVRVPTLTLGSLYLMLGDTGRISVTAKDAAGNAIANPILALHSNDTTVVGAVALRNGQGWVGRKTGVTYIVAQFGTIVDSLQVSVRPKGVATAILAGAARTVVFERPIFDTAATRRLYAQRLDSAARAIKRASIVKEATGRLLAVSAVAGQAAHSSHITRLFSESRTGLLYGGNAELAPFGWFKAIADLRTGKLSTNRATGEEMTLTEMEGQLIFSPAPWFGFGGGYVMRNEKTDLATQRWTFPRVSAASRFAFVGGAVTTVTGVSVLPAANYTGHADTTGKLLQPDPFSLAGEAGIEVRTGFLSAGITYYVERFTFPVLDGHKRRDQFSSLRLRVGLQAGR